jgi:hypothetical protein
MTDHPEIRAMADMERRLAEAERERDEARGEALGLRQAVKEGLDCLSWRHDIGDHAIEDPENAEVERVKEILYRALNG